LHQCGGFGLHSKLLGLSLFEIFGGTTTATTPQSHLNTNSDHFPVIVVL